MKATKVVIKYDNSTPQRNEYTTYWIVGLLVIILVAIFILANKKIQVSSNI